MVVFLPMWGPEIVSDVNGELTTSDRECMAFNAGPGPPIQMSANEQGPDGLIYLCFTFLIGVPIVNCMICLHLMVVLFRVVYLSICTYKIQKNKNQTHTTSNTISFNSNTPLTFDFFTVEYTFSSYDITTSRPFWNSWLFNLEK